MIPIDTDNRMKEITGNLKRDVKELLGESAKIVTGVFKRGACTVRVMADRWKAFAHDVAGTVDTLMKPSFVEGKDAPLQAMPHDGEPTVTVTESIDGNFPVGMQMPLSQANELVGRVSREYIEAEYAVQPVKVRIDFMKDGQTDRYFLPLNIGGGGNLLEQMQDRLERFQGDPDRIASLFQETPEAYREEIAATFAPAVQKSLRELSNSVLPYFQRHCEIANLEQQFQGQAAILTEKERASFQEAARGIITVYRELANTEQPALPHERQKQAPELPQQVGDQKPRQSVKVKLRQLKEAKEQTSSAPHKIHLRPHQRGR